MRQFSPELFPLTLAKYSFGVGDRFAHQAAAQLRACQLAAADGIDVTPVWNKSHREHAIVGSKPADVRRAAEAAVTSLGWARPFHVDADHINLKTVEGFLEDSDYYTLDVADAIGRCVDTSLVDAFLARHSEILAPIILPGFASPLQIPRAFVARAAGKYLFAAQEAGRIYRRIEAARGRERSIIEVSMDETDEPQTSEELLVILAALADERVPLQTIAPKFTGRFNKGVDYIGDPARFEQEFRNDISVIGYAVRTYALPANLKLSIHSGSDKFSLYPIMQRALKDFDCGVHVKTAGTTWLEEVIGLAEAGGDALAFVKEIYRQTYDHREEMCAPYSTVVDIDPRRLPFPDEVRNWSSARFTAALRHDPRCPDFNPHLRQLIHVGYKVAAQQGPRFLDMLTEWEGTIARNVTGNLYERHLKPIFPAGCIPF